MTCVYGYGHVGAGTEGEQSHTTATPPIGILKFWNILKYLEAHVHGLRTGVVVV